MGGLQPEAARPYGARAVWAGYDPQESETGDNAALVIAAPPLREGAPFRILERHQLRGLDFEQQAEFIRAVLARYTCTYLGIDAKGGSGVYQLLAKPGAMPGCAVADRIFARTQGPDDHEGPERGAPRAPRLRQQLPRHRLGLRLDQEDPDHQRPQRDLQGRARRQRRPCRPRLATMHILMNEPLDGKEKPRGTMEIIE
jgi:hypothetical protein